MRLPRSVFLRHCRTNNLPVPSIQPSYTLQLLRQTTCLRRWNSTSTTNLKLPVQIPSSGAVNLTSLRGLLAIHGPDAAKFLQGLITKIFPSETEPNGLFTSFLSPQGRVLFDTFIYTTTPSFVGIESKNDSPVYIIDIDKSLVSNLQLHLKRYKLRSKFQMQQIPESQLQIFSVWPSLASSSTSSSPSLSLTDPRSPHLGTRLLSSTPPSTLLHPEIVYHLRRTLHGVPEGPLEILENQALPAESNLDVMNGVDYSKGCYVGQELTSRTYHTGVIRKRLLPLSIFTKDMSEPDTLSYNPLVDVELPPQGTGLMAEGEKRSPGKWLRGWGNLGWGLCRLDYVGRPLRCEWEGKEVFVKAFMPEWTEGEKNTGSVEK